MAWNCVGKKLASGSVDQTAHILSLDSHGSIRADVSLVGHTDCVDQLTWHPTHPDTLGTASGDKTVRIWDARAGKCTKTIDTKGQNINITWSPNGNYIAVGNKKDIISIIDVRKYKIVGNHKFMYEVNEMAWSKCGNFFLLTTGNGTVEIMSFPKIEKEHQIEAHTGHCYCIEFDPTGRYMATGGADAMVALWELEDLSCVRTFPRLESPLRSLSFSHDGQFIASAAEDFRIDVSHVESGKHVHTIMCVAELNSIAWNPKRHLLAYASDASEKHAGVVSVFGYRDRR